MFGWRQLPKEYPSYDSAGPLKPIELSQWVSKSFNLDEYMSKNLYFIKRELTGEEPTWRYSYKPVESNQEKESYISSFTFYKKFDLHNGVKHGQIIPNYTTYFALRKIINKRETFLNLCYMKHQQLFKSIHSFYTDFTQILHRFTQFLHRFSTEQNYVQKTRGIITTNWLLFYDMYCKQRRDPICTHGKKIFSARYWQDSTTESGSYTISFLCIFKSNLSVPLQFQISQVFSEYTKYNILNEHEVPVIIQDFGTVQKVYRLDPYYSSSNIPKYTYLYTRSSYKNTKEKYTSELPTSDCTQYYKFFNIYYEEDDDIPRCC